MHLNLAAEFSEIEHFCFDNNFFNTLSLVMKLVSLERWLADLDNRYKFLCIWISIGWDNLFWSRLKFITNFLEALVPCVNTSRTCVNTSSLYCLVVVHCLHVLILHFNVSTLDHQICPLFICVDTFSSLDTVFMCRHFQALCRLFNSRYAIVFMCRYFKSHVSTL